MQLTRNAFTTVSARRFVSTAFAVAVALSTGTTFAENFTIAVGDTISPGAPGAGAGEITTVTETDNYTFTATEGQILYLEEISVAPAFKGWLTWDLKSPTARTLMSGYISGTRTDEGRRVLPETGTYTLRVKVGANDPTYVGAYAVRVRHVPADQVFDIQPGTVVSNGVPGVGAGNIEVPGAQDIYRFEGTAGQSAYFEDLKAASAFKGWLQWEVKSPTGKTVLSSYIDGNFEGKKPLPDTGTYTVRVWSGMNNAAYVGDYSFRIRPVPQDQEFTIQVGQTVTNGVPAAGAGNIEATGAVDTYTFQGTAGQVVFLEQIAASDAFRGWLRWEGKTPGGATLFGAYFGSGGPVGRKTLPETGTYKLMVFAGSSDPNMVGTYSFRLSGVDDSRIPLTIGQWVTNNVPAQGAGVIETSGGQDLYSFEGTSGQRVTFKPLYDAAAFKGYLRYEIRTPASNRLALTWFEPNEEEELVLPETGTYSIRIYAESTDPEMTGDYSFRTFSRVYAWPDRLGVSPGQTVAIPVNKFMCNDTGEAMDVLSVSLLGSGTGSGGTVVHTNGTIRYTPAQGFTGEDTFVYQLSGVFGGTAPGTVSIVVGPEAGEHPSIVSFKRTSATNVTLCLFGPTNTTSTVERTDDLLEWSNVGTVTMDASGSATYEYTTDDRPMRFYRFRKQ